MDTNGATAQELERIEALALAATRGPWSWDDHPVPTLSARAGDPAIYAYDTEVIEADHGGECGCRSACELELSISDQDKAFIAATSPDVVLGLIAQVRGLRKEAR